MPSPPPAGSNRDYPTFSTLSPGHVRSMNNPNASARSQRVLPAAIPERHFHVVMYIVVRVHDDGLFSLLFRSLSRAIKRHVYCLARGTRRTHRVLKTPQKVAGEEERPVRINPSVVSLLKMLVYMTYIAHILGCMWHWLVTFEQTGISWASKFGVEEASTLPRAQGARGDTPAIHGRSDW